MPFVRFSRDKRGYEHTYLLHAASKKGAPARVLYWYRTPPGVRVGRPAFDDELRRALEAQYPGIEFDWPSILSASIQPVEVEHWRERRRAEKAAKQARQAAVRDDAPDDDLQVAELADRERESPADGSQGESGSRMADERPSIRSVPVQADASPAYPADETGSEPAFAADEDEGDELDEAGERSPEQAGRGARPQTEGAVVGAEAPGEQVRRRRRRGGRRRRRPQGSVPSGGEAPAGRPAASPQGLPRTEPSE